MNRIVRTVIVKSVKLPRKAFRVFIELEDIYRNMVEQLVLYAVRNNIKSFTKLKALKYHEMRSLYLDYLHIMFILLAKMLVLEPRASYG